MPDTGPIGKSLIIFGIVLIVTGLVFVFGPKLLHLGRLPGDIFLRRGNFSFYFPIATSIIVSIVLTILLNLIFRR